MAIHPSIEADAYDLVLFDADGTLRRCKVANQPCPNRDGEWELIAGVKEQLHAFPWQASGIITGIVSNQAGVSLGYLDEGMVWALLHDLHYAAFGFSAYENFIRWCPHGVNDNCECRKPKPKMILDAIDCVFGGKPERTLYVGDLESDKQAAANAGVHFLWVWEFFGKSQDEWVGWLAMRADEDRAKVGASNPVVDSTTTA